MKDELEPSPDLDPTPLVDPWLLATLIYPGLLVTLLTASILPLYLALPLGMLTSYAALRIRNLIRNVLPPWAIQSWGAWLRSPRRIYPGKDPQIPPAIRE